MSDIKQFLVIPREMEQILSQIDNENKSNSKDREESMNIDDISKMENQSFDSLPESLSNLAITTKDEKKPRQKATRQGEERISRISKLALLLAKNNAYNELFHIKKKDGSFNENSDVSKFFKFATQKLRRFDHLNDYIYQLSLLDYDLSNLITNPVVLRLVEEELQNRNSINKEKEPTQEVAMDLSTKEPPTKKFKIDDISGSGVEKEDTQWMSYYPLDITANDIPDWIN